MKRKLQCALLYVYIKKMFEDSEKICIQCVVFSNNYYALIFHGHDKVIDETLKNFI